MASGSAFTKQAMTYLHKHVHACVREEFPGFTFYLGSLIDCLSMKNFTTIICWTTITVLSSSDTVIVGKFCSAGCSGQGLGAVYGAAYLNPCALVSTACYGTSQD